MGTRERLTQVMAEPSDLHTEDVSASDEEFGLPLVQSLNKSPRQVTHPEPTTEQFIQHRLLVEIPQHMSDRKSHTDKQMLLIIYVTSGYCMRNTPINMIIYIDQSFAMVGLRQRTSTEIKGVNGFMGLNLFHSI